MMTETIPPAESPAAEAPHLPRPQTHGPGRQHEMQQRQREMQDCVDKILAKVDPAATAG
jgi:hypothetical protein